MIFACVGTQFPFERMMDSLATWKSRNAGTEIIAQVGKGGRYHDGIECFETLEKASFDAIQQRASLIVSHAGMGSIISALCSGIPIVLVPRLAELKEHRNDHQVATAKSMSDRPGVVVAWNDEELFSALDRRSELTSGLRLSPYAPAALTDELRRLALE